MNKNKGFTLIELLVVIAIIGILASVVLASLSSARDKGKDAAVKSQLASMKAQGELYYSSTNETYAGVCTAVATANGFAGLLGAAKDSAAIVNSTNTVNTTLSAAGAWDTVTCHEDGNSWAVEAPLNTSLSSKADMYCVDSTGVSKEEIGTNLAATTGLSC